MKINIIIIENVNDPKKLILVCKILVKSEMLRFASDVNGYYKKGVMGEFEKSDVDISKYVKKKDSEEFVNRNLGKLPIIFPEFSTLLVIYKKTYRRIPYNWG